MKLPDDADDNECGEYWQCYPTYTPKDFFEMLKDQYRRCEVVSIHHTHVNGSVILESSSSLRYYVVPYSCNRCTKG